jgi:hypothetical protein
MCAQDPRNPDTFVVSKVATEFLAASVEIWRLALFRRDFPYAARQARPERDPMTFGGVLGGMIGKPQISFGARDAGKLGRF